MKTVRIKREYFDQINSNLKTLEARIKYPDIQQIEVGQKLKFECGNNSLIRQVKAIRAYNTIRVMLENEDLEKLLPGIGSKHIALLEYERFYPPWKVASFGGVLVFELE